MKKTVLISIMLLATLLGSCAKTPQIPRLSKDGIILAFGDSLTFGTGAGESESYPSQLEKALGRKVINAGVPGEVSATGAQRLPDLLDREKPALLILCHGGNDLLQKLDQKGLAENLRTMIRMARDRGVSVVLLAVPSFNLSLEPPPLYGEVAAEFAVPLELKSLPKILGKSSLKADYIHPNGAGYLRLSGDILKLLKKSGAIP